MTTMFNASQVMQGAPEVIAYGTALMGKVKAVPFILCSFEKKPVGLARKGSSRHLG
ncbi:MAG: YbjQ family protein [Agathobacter sp.]|nr:YbjQ family protein [Agathobacter sp.]